MSIDCLSLKYLTQFILATVEQVLHDSVPIWTIVYHISGRISQGGPKPFNSLSSLPSVHPDIVTLLLGHGPNRRLAGKLFRFVPGGQPYLKLIVVAKEITVAKGNSEVTNNK